MSDATDTAANAEGAAKAGPNKMALIGAIVGGLAVGVGAGMFAVGPKVAPAPTAEQMALIDSVNAEAAKHEKKKGGGHGEGGEGEAAAPLVKLENLIVNPAGTEGARFLMTSIAIQLATAEEAQALQGREPELRDAVTSVLAAQSLTELAAPDARTRLKGKIVGVVQPMLGEDAEAPKVFIPTFVIQ